MGPQRGINKKKEPKLSVKGLIKLLEARNIMLPPALMHRALEAMRKPGEGTEINMRAFLKIMGESLLPSALSRTPTFLIVSLTERCGVLS